MDESNTPHNNQEPGFFERLGEALVDNGRLLLTALIILLLIGAGIYAYTQDSERAADTTSVAQDDSMEEATTIYEGEGQTSTDQEENTQGQEEDANEQESDSQGESSSSESEESNSDSNSEENEAPGETIYTGTADDSEEQNETTGSDYTFNAQPGDGVTHLARRAVGTYLEENPDQAEQVTPAHRIYMETVLTKNNYQASLNLDETVNFSDSEVEQVVEDAIDLPEEEVENWQPYVAQVSSIGS
jgi:hypothetical protein